MVKLTLTSRVHKMVKHTLKFFFLFLDLLLTILWTVSIKELREYKKILDLKISFCFFQSLP